MRWWPLLVIVAALAGRAIADPIRLDLLIKRTRDDNALVRAEAAKQLAEHVDRGSGFLIAIEMVVISNDPQVRQPLLDVLVAKNVIPESAAALVPTTDVMAKMIKTLLPKVKDLPPVTLCSVVGGTSRGAQVRCLINKCSGSRHVRQQFDFTTGVRWTVATGKRSATDDGTCSVNQLID